MWEIIKERDCIWEKVWETDNVRNYKRERLHLRESMRETVLERK